MITLILIFVVLFVINYIVGAAMLTWLAKIFKIEKFTFKNSLIIIFLSGVAGFVASIIFGTIDLGIISDMAVMVATFGVFYFLLKKYYQIDWKRALGIWFIFSIIGIVLSLIIVIPLRTFVVEPFVVSGESMNPNYMANDYLLLSKFEKQFFRGDVIVYRNPKAEGSFLVKRIVGLPGDKTEIKNGRVFINGEVLSEPYAEGMTVGDGSLVLKSDEYYVLGDNRIKSLDSRLLGPVKFTDIRGKVIYNFK